MRKILLTASVFAAGVLVYGAVGSGAWFTDTARVPVTATAATIDIEAIGPNATGIALEDLAPGVTTEAYQLHVYNTGNSTVPVKYRITASEGVVTLVDDDSLFDALDVEVRHGHCVTGTPLGHDDTVGVVYDGPLSGLEVVSAQSITGPEGALPTNTTHCYSLTFSLDESVGNEAQGGTASFDIVIDATQLENPGFGEEGNGVGNGDDHGDGDDDGDDTGDDTGGDDGVTEPEAPETPDAA